jgi:hypothetical protein
MKNIFYCNFSLLLYYYYRNLAFADKKICERRAPELFLQSSTAIRPFIKLGILSEWTFPSK